MQNEINTLKQYINNHYDNYHGDVIDNNKQEIIKNLIVKSKGQPYFELVHEFAELNAQEPEICGFDERRDFQNKLNQIANKLGFTTAELDSFFFH
jgi:hypothetical protein